MRQKDDKSFAELLNRLREGNHTEEDMRALKSRKVDLGAIRTLKALPHLFCCRQDVSKHNVSALNELPPTDLVTTDAIDDISGNISTSLRSTILSKIPNDSKLTMGLQNQLTLGIGMPSEMCVNVDTEDGLTNGASCCIKKFDFRVPNSERCSIIWVEFDDENIGRKWRIRYRHLYKSSIPATWTPVIETSRCFNFRYFKTYLVVRRQFPLCLSAAKTIHKAQGSTMNAAVLHFGQRKTDHIHYVGLSRVTSLSQLFIIELNESKICVSLEVEAEIERLRRERQLVGCVPSLESFQPDVLKVCFHNCRSLQKHFEDFKHDRNLLSADIIGLAETRVWDATDSRYVIEGYNFMCASNEQSTHGLCIYYRSTLNIDLLDCKAVSDIEYMLFGINQEIVIGFVYCPPAKATVVGLEHFLSTVAASVSQYAVSETQHKLVLMGDFNFDCLVYENSHRSRLFRRKLSLKQLINCATCDYDTCIDHIYTSLCDKDVVAYGTLESYFSDHKPLFLAFPLQSAE